MQQGKGCTAVGSPVAGQVSGCKGRSLLSPGLGRAGHPFIFGHGRNEGAGFRTLFEAKVWPGGASPAGT